MDNNSTAANQPPVNPEVMQDMPKTNPTPTNTASQMDPTLVAVIIWIIPVIGGLIYMNDKDSYVSFMAKQSMYLGVSYIILSIVAQILLPGLLYTIVNIAWLVIAIMMIMKMQKREMYKLPIIGDMVK